MTKPTMQPNEISEVLNRPISQELLARDVTRLGYAAKDGTPRAVMMPSDDGKASGLRAVGPCCGLPGNRRTRDAETGATGPSCK